MEKPNVKNKKRGKGSMEVPDGAIPQKELEKIINHQNDIPPIDLPVAVAQNQEGNRGKLYGEMESGPAEEYDAPPRKPRLQAAERSTETLPSSEIATPPQLSTVETAPQKPVRVEEEHPVEIKSGTANAAMENEKSGVQKETPEWLEEDYIGLIRDYHEKLFFEGNNLAEVLKENGLKSFEPWVKETRRLLEEDEIAKNCLEYTLEVLSKKYKDKPEKIENAVLKNELDQIPEIKQETTKAILVYYEQALEAILEKTKAENNRAIIGTEAQKVKVLLGEEIPEANDLIVDKSGENTEQKELGEKIKVALRDAMKFTLGEIDEEIKKIKREAGTLINKGIDEKKLSAGVEEIENRTLDNLDGYAKVMFQYLKDNQQSPHLDQMMKTEARRMMNSIFTSNREIDKILPQSKISREVDAGKAAAPATADKTADGAIVRETTGEEVMGAENPPKKETKTRLKEEKLSEEQKKIFGKLMQRTEETFEKIYGKMEPGQMEKIRNSNESVFQNVRNILAEMILDPQFSQKNLEYFEKYFQNPDLFGYYQSLRGKREVSRKYFEKHRQDFIGFMVEQARGERYSVGGIELVRRYFSTLTLLEKRHLYNRHK